MKNTRTVFKPKILIKILVIFQLAVYLCWAFIEWSLITPITVTFGDDCGRGTYLFSLIAVCFMTLPFYLPDEDVKDNDQK